MNPVGGGFFTASIAETTFTGEGDDFSVRAAGLGAGVSGIASLQSTTAEHFDDVLRNGGAHVVALRFIEVIPNVSGQKQFLEWVLESQTRFCA